MTINLFDIIVFTVCAAVSAMGMGGGGLLIPYLVSFRGVSRLSAQGINLLFFIPCSLTSIIIYFRNGWIKPKIILPMLLGGIAGALAGSVIIKHIKPEMLSTVFSLFLIASGAFAIFHREK